MNVSVGLILLFALAARGASALAVVKPGGVCLPLNCQACSQPLTCIACTSNYAVNPLGQCTPKASANGECTAFSANRNAQCKTFDDLPSSVSNTFLQYANLFWFNFYAWNPDTDSKFEGTGYDTGRVSSPQIAFNGFGKPAGFYTLDKTFNLNYLYATAAFDEGLNVTVVGLSGSKRLEKSFKASTLGPVKVVFDPLVWRDLEVIEIITSNGRFPFPFGTQVAIDNLALSSSLLNVSPFVAQYVAKLNSQRVQSPVGQSHWKPQ